MVTLLDYGAGNVRSVTNALEYIGANVKVTARAEDIQTAEMLVFPGVGAFASMMAVLREKNLVAVLQAYLASDRPFLGICLGLQALFENSDEAPGVKGLGFLKGSVKRFETDMAVPHIGWNGIRARQSSRLFKGLSGEERFYFVHSYHVCADEPDKVLTHTDYGQPFISAIRSSNIVATQFHPEKSGAAGLKMLQNFIENDAKCHALPSTVSQTRLARRIIACLDVRANDAGDLVVTKGDQYDVREKGEVRNLGKPVALAKRYYEEGADEITFLNITGFRAFPLADVPMLEVLRQTSRNVFVPLTIGGGIRDYEDRNGKCYDALDVAAAYFRSGADKVSIGSDAVDIAMRYLQTGQADGTSAIEKIARVYGNQAVVISVDPRRVYTANPDDCPHQVIATRIPGPDGEHFCWYQCTVNGGRKGCDIDAITFCQICEKLGAGEILLNCIDRDGTGGGFDSELIGAVKKAVGIPVIASSGAGNVQHFHDVFRKTDADAALAAGIFHRCEVSIEAVKDGLAKDFAVRSVRS